MSKWRDKVNRHRAVALSYLVSLLLIAGGWLWVWAVLRKSGQPLILHFNNLAGINQVGSLRDLVPIGVFSLALVIISFFIGLDLEEKDWFLGKLLAGATFTMSALIFIGFAAIISVN